MRKWHPRCQDPACYLRCQRPGCLLDFHYDQRFDRALGVYFHVPAWVDCRVDPTEPVLAPVVALRPDAGLEEIAVARRVLLEALDELEQLRAQRSPTERLGFLKRWRRGRCLLCALELRRAAQAVAWRWDVPPGRMCDRCELLVDAAPTLVLHATRARP